MKFLILGGLPAALLFVVVLAAYVVQSQLTQYVQSDLAYRQPYFIFYIAHSSFIIIFPLHLLYLTIATGKPARAYLRGLRDALCDQFSSSSASTTTPDRTTSSLFPDSRSEFPIRTLLKAVLFLTGGATVPSSLWYASVSLTPISDVTAIFNTHAFWAYVLTVVITRSKWERSKLFAVLLACIGVFVVVYGGHDSSSPGSGSGDDTTAEMVSAKAIAGGVVTLIASFTYALYQVLYKKYIALVSTEGDAEVRYEALQGGSTLSGPSRHSYSPFSDHNLGSTKPDEQEDEYASSIGEYESIPPPFGFHANFFTSGIGLGTLLILWLPLWLVHYTGVLEVALPPDGEILAYVLAISGAGLVYNAGFMILLGVWGPVIASVGNLLTIVLVMISDIIVSGVSKAVTPWSLLGCAMIVGAFSVLVVDILGN